MNCWQPKSVMSCCELRQRQDGGNVLFLASYCIGEFTFRVTEITGNDWMSRQCFCRIPISEEPLKNSLIPNLCARPHSPPLQEEGFTGFMRTLRGRDQEKVIRKKEELWGRPCREGERGTAHFVIALWPLTFPLPHPHPQQGPYEHWRGRLDDLNERLFFYSRVITFVKTPTEYLQSDRPLDFFCF